MSSVIPQVRYFTAFHNLPLFSNWYTDFAFLTGAPRLHARKKEEERLAEKRTPLPKPPPIKTDKEKDDLRRKMKDKYEVKYDIPERILFMALESVLFDEEQANNLM